MKLGFVSAILDTWTYEEMMDFAADHGFECVEVACWPQGKAERRYAGVSHIDVDRVLEDDAYAKHILDYSKEKNVDISSLAFYPNTMDGDPEKKSGSGCTSEKCNPCKRKAGRRHGNDIYRKRPDKDSGRKSGTGEGSMAFYHQTCRRK